MPCIGVQKHENILDYMHAKPRIISKCPVTIREKEEADFLVCGLRNESTRTTLILHFKATDRSCYELIELTQEIAAREECLEGSFPRSR